MKRAHIIELALQKAHIGRKEFYKVMQKLKSKIYSSIIGAILKNPHKPTKAVNHQKLSPQIVTNFMDDPLMGCKNGD